jgi:translation initiation factor IF-1
MDRSLSSKQAFKGSMKEAIVEMSGTVIGTNRGSATVELDNGTVIKGILAGRLIRHRIRIVAGDKVVCEISPCDVTKGRMIWRSK